MRNDIARLSTELDEIRGENLSKDENIAELQEENVELAKQVKELGEEPGDKPVKLNKFTKNNKKTELSKAEYNKLSAKDRFWYNLNN